MKYYALAYYQFVELDEPRSEIKKHKNFFKERDVSGRLYISEEGINGQMSGSKEDVDAYIEWLTSDKRFASTYFKLHPIELNVFPRMTVKYRKQLVALDMKIDTAQGGDHVSPKKWKEMLEDDQDYLLLDVRNDYESKIGRFEGATLPPIKTFREFPGYAKQLAKERDPKKTKVMMYCTGGIRCELYSALMKEEGFEEVYQLDGGVIGYGLEEGNEHWEGKLFVFDDRMAIPIDKNPVEPIAQCDHCEVSCDTYYNCANMNCNNLYLCCETCLEKLQGCCSESCLQSPNRRAFNPSRGNTPFRKKHLCKMVNEEPTENPSHTA